MTCFDSIYHDKSDRISLVRSAVNNKIDHSSRASHITFFFPSWRGNEHLSIHQSVCVYPRPLARRPSFTSIWKLTELIDRYQCRISLSLISWIIWRWSGKRMRTNGKAERRGKMPFDKFRIDSLFVTRECNLFQFSKSSVERKLKNNKKLCSAIDKLTFIVGKGEKLDSSFGKCGKH